MTNRKDDRDATIDRLLAGAMTHRTDDAAGEPVSPKLGFGRPSEGGPVPPKREPREGGCLEADTLAAWADNALSASELAAAEAHAADCARCQAMLAAMAKTAPAPTAAVTPRWMPSLRWLVPLTATAATAAVLWIFVPLGGTRPVNVRQVSQVAESSPPPPPSLAEPPSSTASAPAADRERRAQPTPAEAKERELDPSRQSADLSRRSAEGAKAEGAKAEDAKAEGANASAMADAPSRRADLRLEKAPAAADLSRRSAEGAKADQAAAPPAAPAVAGAATRTFAFGAPETVIVSSNPASRWRILQGGAVQRSADGGATWQTQNTGVTETLTAGASPSPSVCWLVGPRGIVLLSTDGRSWKRVAVPESVPLVAVSPIDGETATVTTADGRQFVTDDGGRTWTRPPG